MTTITLQINEKNPEFLEAFNKLMWKFKDSIKNFEISDFSSDEEILDNFKKVYKDIKIWNALKNAKPISELYKELSYD